MDIVNRSQDTQDVGYLVIRVSTARGAIPLEGAAVTVRGGSEETSGVVYSLSTNRDGITAKVELPTPPLNLSASPGNSTPYSLWSVDVFKDGYSPVSYQNLPVYPSIVSVQPAVMLPRVEGAPPSPIFNESESPAL